MIRSLLTVAALSALLAACAQPQRAAAPAPEVAPEAKPAGPVAIVSPEGVIRVKSDIADQDALAPLHCSAALRAQETGASAIEWVGGIASPKSNGGYAAEMAYETTFDKRLRRPKPGVEPADGGLVATESWLTYCDEAGIPRRGEA